MRSTRKRVLVGVVMMLSLLLASCKTTEPASQSPGQTEPQKKAPHSGDPAPDLSLRNQDQIKISLSEFKDKKNVILVFYPADFTPV